MSNITDDSMRHWYYIHENKVNMSCLNTMKAHQILDKNYYARQNKKSSLKAKIWSMVKINITHLVFRSFMHYSWSAAHFTKWDQIPYIISNTVTTSAEVSSWKFSGWQMFCSILYTKCWFQLWSSRRWANSFEN